VKEFVIDTEAKSMVKVGCCGFRMAMAEYALRFPVVEVQQTFYQPPKVQTLERWRAEAPPDFEFTLKAWQLITHEARSPTYRRLKRNLTEQELNECGAFRPSAIVREAWSTTLACACARSSPHSVSVSGELYADQGTRGGYASLLRFD